MSNTQVVTIKIPDDLKKAWKLRRSAKECLSTR